MTFLAPLYLLLGVAAGVPLLLHLLRRNIASRVDFPAARYLQRAEQEHSRSLRIRNLLLMLLRVLLVLTLAIAAARPFVAGLGVGHGPTAVAVVLDNSLSTTAVTNGAPMFNKLRDAARSVLEASTPGDKLWLVTADGKVRGGTRETLVAELMRISPIQTAGDLPLALRRGAAAVQGSPLPARVVAVATDGQRTAWSSATRRRRSGHRARSCRRSATQSCRTLCRRRSRSLDAARLHHVAHRCHGFRWLSRGAWRAHTRARRRWSRRAGAASCLATRAWMASLARGARAGRLRSR